MFEFIDMVQIFCKECLVPLFISHNNKQKNNWLPCGKRNHQHYQFNTVTSYLPHVPPLQLALSGVFTNIVIRFNGAKTIADLTILIFRCPTDDHFKTLPSITVHPLRIIIIIIIIIITDCLTWDSCGFHPII